MVELPVYLDNVSSAGCAARSDRPPVPQPGEPIWFKASGIDRFDWVVGTLISTRRSLLGKYKIRIRFLAPLPYDTFKFLVYWPDDGRPQIPGPIPLHETDWLWR
jgi:hypothetical protein